MRPVRRSCLRQLTRSLCIIATLLSGAAYAALTITENVAPSFGVLLGGATGRQFILNTDDTVTGADAADYLFGAVSGELELDNKGQQGAINILADNISASGGLTVTRILCSYRGGPQQACDGAGITEQSGRKRILKVGIDFTTNIAHSAADTPSVTLDISVIFL